MPSILPQHPGEYVRKNALLPQKIKVTDAAKLLAIGRPALSNFLNGNAAASPDMATRIERAFTIPAQKLLDMQAAYDAAKAKSRGVAARTTTYVPKFLDIKANEIETWGSAIAARPRFAVFLRTLVNSTGIGLTKVDFPGNDDAERPGWDGTSIASEGTPWVPEGQTGWEFGTSDDPKTKADGDYKIRTGDADKDAMTFIFVTPRRWAGKEKWTKARQAEGKWKDVRAYDSSDLEQWLAQSVAGQTWFADEIKRGFSAANSLDECWNKWANVTHPPLAGELFKTQIDSARERVKAFLAKPSEQPLVIAADSTEEALAFLAQLFSVDTNDFPATRTRDRIVVFRDPGILPKLAAGSSGFIAVAFNREVERELAPYVRKIHSIVVCPRNATNASPDITLQPLSFQPFETGLQAMGFERDKMDRLARESGRSLTVLRRILSKIDAIRIPEWAADSNTAARLVPFFFAGAWNADNQSDRIILEFLFEKRADQLEKDVQELSRLNDAPVWWEGTHRGVISKISLLFAVYGCVTKADVDRFFEVARRVLSEKDPALDLPDNDKWTAGMYGKTREISSALRSGICETLVLLAVHGDALLQSRLAVNFGARAAKLVKDLLSPLTTRQLEEHDRDLPMYAEAAPEEFLAILETDLKSPNPASLGLMRPVDSGVFAKCVRSEILWALEGLCWSPATLLRALRILARFSQVKLEDNWANKPIASIQSVFRAWMPQTAANLSQRISVVEKLVEGFPDVVWRICMDQFGEYNQVGHYSHKPRWRDDAQGFGEATTRKEAFEFMIAMVEMALNWKIHTKDTIGDLIDRIHALDDERQARVWRLVEKWAATASDSDRAWMREKIRVRVMSRRAKLRRGGKAAGALGTAAQAAYDSLEPTDIFNRHEWLFRQQWVEESADELEGDDFDYQKREERINKLRTTALEEILAKRGVQGILEFSALGKAPPTIGFLMAKILSTAEVASFILSAMPCDASGDTWSRKNLAYGAMRGLADDSARRHVLNKMKQALPEERFATVLQFAPFAAITWEFVDGLTDAARAIYWSRALPNWDAHSDEEINDGIRRLLKAKRPRAAFALVNLRLEKVIPGLLYQLMMDIAIGGDEQAGQYSLEPWSISQAFQLMDKSNEFSVDKMAILEFPYIEALSRSIGQHEARGVPNLEKYVESHPEIFVQAVAWTYMRSDGEEDPPELVANSSEERTNRAQRGYTLLDALERLPGQDALTADERRNRLLEWIDNVRSSCAALGRLSVCDLSLGKLFSSVDPGEDGVWPPDPVRSVIEQIQSDELASGITTALYNSRGAHWRAEGGGQERAIAEKYRRWGDALEITHPFIASKIHRQLQKTYEHEAKMHDTEAAIARRLP